VDNLFLAGEHTSSFYEQQGFMEGAALSGSARRSRFTGPCGDDRFESRWSTRGSPNSRGAGRCDAPPSPRKRYFALASLETAATRGAASLLLTVPRTRMSVGLTSLP
jgi:hypothetical protein